MISSSLVKAAVHGRDPNWGRIAGAAGNARFADAAVLEAAGLPADEAAAQAGHGRRRSTRRRSGSRSRATSSTTAAPAVRCPSTRPPRSAAMGGDEVLIRLDLGLGEGTGEAFGCDLTEEYVRENSEYTT